MNYSKEDFLTAYRAWVVTYPLALDPENKHQYAIRQEAWDKYCDIRDGYRPGTSLQRRLIQERKSGYVQ